MTLNPTYNKHLAGLTAFFILGGAVISLPVADSGGASLLGFLFAAVAAVILYFAAVPVTARLILGKKSKPALCVFLLLAAVYALYNAGAAFTVYIDFADKILLPETPRFFIAALFVLTAVYLATRRQEVILKLSLIFIVLALAASALFFALSAKDYNAENIAVNSFPSFKELISGLKPYFFKVSLPALLIPVYSALFTEEKRVSAPFFGLLAGLSVIALSLLESLLLFGAPLAKRLSFPLASAVSTVTVGQLFSRMDGIVYCFFFASALIKAAVCMKLAFFALKRLKN